MHAPETSGAAGRIAAACLNSIFTPIFIVFCILAGVSALLKLPREEEPQIVVPTMDVLVEYPGATAHEVEERVARPLEETGVGDPRRRVCLFDVQSGKRVNRGPVPGRLQ